jgi:hypothetical protein
LLVSGSSSAALRGLKSPKNACAGTARFRGLISTARWQRGLVLETAACDIAKLKPICGLEQQREANDFSKGLKCLQAMYKECEVAARNRHRNRPQQPQGRFPTLQLLCVCLCADACIESDISKAIVSINGWIIKATTWLQGVPLYNGCSSAWNACSCLGSARPDRLEHNLLRHTVG